MSALWDEDEIMGLAGDGLAGSRKSVSRRLKAEGLFG